MLDVAAELKELQRQRQQHRLLEGRVLGLLFDKPSTRTRVSFEAGIAQLGGSAVFMTTEQLQLVRGEPLRDTAIVLSRYMDALAVRISAHEQLAALADHSSVPVLNALTDAAHPCQALADVQTLREGLGDLRGRTLAWVGDGTNVCASVLVAAARLGMRVVVAAPPGYEPAAEAVASAGGEVRLVEDPRVAVAGADAVYTDVWTSMGQEPDAERRRRDLEPYRLDASLLAGAAPGACVLHCLPAHAGEEITADVLYGRQSAVWDQAENRLHVQKALLTLVVE